jgi:WD40 repeat protein
MDGWSDSNHGGPIAFRTDGCMMAILKLEHDEVLVHLVDPRTGLEMAALRPPEPLPVTTLSFSPDGRQLAVGTKAHRIQLWDLSLVQNGLEKLSLDPGIPLDFDAHFQESLPSAHRGEMGIPDR